MSVETNFGGNQTWRARRYRPADEQAVLDILRRHADTRIRAFGAQHSWSDVAACGGGVSLDLRDLDRVETFISGGETFVRVQAGCRLQRLLDKLHAMGERTLPTLGAVKQQTISGATSTGTHGSGRQSLSHFIAAVRVAAYAGGKAQIFEYRDGEELAAARCALGCLGIVLSVDLRTVPKYKVEEQVARCEDLGEILALYAEHPLTQFVLLPHGWSYLAYRRKPLADRRLTLRERLCALAMRLYHTALVDVLLHLMLKAVLLGGDRRVKRFFKTAARLAPGSRRLDDAERVLTLGHHYFRHEEMELFVPESRLPEAVEILRFAADWFSGEDVPMPEALAAKLRPAGLYDELVASRGRYTPHYPFLFRKVLPDDTLISMSASASEPRFSLSVFTYHAPNERAAYYAFCSWLARTLHLLVDARLHWGKHFPLGEAHAVRAYPDLERFRQICRGVDPGGVFRNDFTSRVLGL